MHGDLLGRAALMALCKAFLSAAKTVAILRLGSHVSGHSQWSSVRKTPAAAVAGWPSLVPLDSKVAVVRFLTREFMLVDHMRLSEMWDAHKPETGDSVHFVR